MIKTRIEPLGREFAMLFERDVSPAARSKVHAQFHAEQREKARAGNAEALGRAPAVETFVDGRAGAPLESVRPDGRIASEFDLIAPAVEWILDTLREHSPIGRTRKYVRSHRVLVNGEEVETLPRGFGISEVVIVPLVPYAPPIERGFSKQAPDGVYRAVAAMARTRYGRFANVVFAWRSIRGLDHAQPAIVFTVK